MTRIATKAILSVISLVALAGVARAQDAFPLVRFAPPPNPILDPAVTPLLNPANSFNAGTIFEQTAYLGGVSNDGFSLGRGIVFTPNANFDLRSVGVRLNVPGVTVNFLVALAGSTGPGSVSPGATLRTGFADVNTGGQLDFVNFIFDTNPLPLLAGQNYLVQFQFTGNPLQNQFFDTRNTQTEPGRSWTQGGPSEGVTLENVRGTLGGNTFPTAVPITLNFIGGTVAAIAPEPGTVALLGVGIGLLALRLHRRA